MFIETASIIPISTGDAILTAAVSQGLGRAMAGKQLRKSFMTHASPSLFVYSHCLVFGNSPGAVTNQTYVFEKLTNIYSQANPLTIEEIIYRANH